MTAREFFDRLFDRPADYGVTVWLRLHGDRTPAAPPLRPRRPRRHK